MRISEPKLAEESFRRALQINPRDADGHNNFGWMLCQQGRNSRQSGCLRRRFQPLHTQVDPERCWLRVCAAPRQVTVPEAEFGFDPFL